MTTTHEQLTFDGSAVPYPMPRPHHLTERQRDLLRFVRAVGEYGSPTATCEAKRFYADPSGALRRLEALGLVVRTARGRWKVTT